MQWLVLRGPSQVLTDAGSRGKVEFLAQEEHLCFPRMRVNYRPAGRVVEGAGLRSLLVGRNSESRGSRLASTRLGKHVSQ